jgi:hypothetical protein
LSSTAEKTNVDVERAPLIQFTLDAASAHTCPPKELAGADGRLRAQEREMK